MGTITTRAHLDLGVMRDGNVAMLVGRDNNLKNAEVTFLHGVRVTVPSVCCSQCTYSGRRGLGILAEVASEEGLLGIWRPLPVDDIVVLVDVETEDIDALN